MISKQKLLQWINDKQYTYGGPYANSVEENKCFGALKILSLLERDINAGEFVVDNGEEVKG